MALRLHTAKNRELEYKQVGRVSGRGSFKMVPATSRQATAAAPLPATSMIPPPPVVDPPTTWESNDGPSFEVPDDGIEGVRKKSGKVGS
jgi:hypothetical protein